MANTDYLYVYQGASVAITTTDLLSNDSDPQGQTMTVVAVSEPGTDGTLTGDLANGFTYTPGNDPALVGTDHTLNYLVTDTAGHVDQADIIVRILAAGDTNQPPVARDDVARTNIDASVNRFVIGNDFDPDGDSFSIVRILTPPHGTVTNFGSAIIYTPNPGFTGVEQITYTLRDSHGLTANGTLTVWVDTGVLGPETPVANTDYLYVYQGASVAITTADLLSNDSDPQGQTMTVVAVSEPGTAGTLTGDLANGFTYTPGNDPALVGTDHTLNYLVTDTAGHVDQADIIVRILAAGDTNQPPVARDDVARTNIDASVNRFVIGNDFDPDGDSFSIVRILTPPHGTVTNFGSSIIYIPNPGFTGVEQITYTLRDSHGLTANGTLTVWVDTGVTRPGDTGGQHRLLVRLPRRLGGHHHRRSVVQRQRPARPNPDRRRGLRTRHRRHPHRRPRQRLHLHTRQRPGPGRHRPHPQLPRHRHRRPRRPSRHHRPHPRRRRHQPTTRRSRRCGAHEHRRQCQSVRDRQRLRSRRRLVQHRPNPQPRHTAPWPTSDPRSSTSPTPASPASNRSPTPLRDSHGLTANGTLTVWVDTGVLGPETPVANTDYLYVYQGASVAITTADLLSNDSDPQGQTLTVVAVSEPGTAGTLTGNLANGFTYTPGNDPALVGTDHTLNYLVTDTAGHVDQADIIVRILAAGDPNQPPVAVPDTATSTATRQYLRGRQRLRSRR